MSYVEYLRDVLSPLHIYDLDNGPGADEIRVLGAALDDVFSELETTLREMTPITAESYGLENYENILPYEPAALSLADRRAAIEAMSSVSGFSLAELNKSIWCSGIEAVVTEYGPETVCVSFPHAGGDSIPMDELKQRIEQILPCHLEIVYEEVYITWKQLNHENFTWKRLEYEELTWYRLQNYEVE